VKDAIASVAERVIPAATLSASVFAHFTEHKDAYMTIGIAIGALSSFVLMIRNVLGIWHDWRARKVKP